MGDCIGVVSSSEAMDMKTAWHFVRGTGDNMKLRDGSSAVVGEWLEYTGEAILRASGLHASWRAIDALPFVDWAGGSACLVEVDNVVAEDTDKFVCTRRRIIFAVDCDELLRQFAAQAALSVLHLWQVGVPAVVREYLETGNEDLRVAASDATWAARSAGATAGDAAWAATTAATASDEGAAARAATAAGSATARAAAATARAAAAAADEAAARAAATAASDADWAAARATAAAWAADRAATAAAAAPDDAARAAATARAATAAWDAAYAAADAAYAADSAAARARADATSAWDAAYAAARDATACDLNATLESLLIAAAIQEGFDPSVLS